MLLSLVYDLIMFFRKNVHFFVFKNHLIIWLTSFESIQSRTLKLRKKSVQMRWRLLANYSTSNKKIDDAAEMINRIAVREQKTYFVYRLDKFDLVTMGKCPSFDNIFLKTLK